jgi:hypothetical protein
MEIIKGNKTLFLNKEFIRKIKVNHLELEIQKKTKILNEKLQEENINMEILLEKFTPNKTSKNGLSFFNQREYNELITKDQAIEIINFFKFFCLIIENKIIPNDNDKDFIKLFLERTFPETSNLSNFFIKKI